MHSVSQISYVVCQSLNRLLGLFTFMKLKLIRSNPKVSNRTLFASNKQMIGVAFPKKTCNNAGIKISVNRNVLRKSEGKKECSNPLFNVMLVISA